MQIEYENINDERFISSFGENYIVIQKQKYFDNVIIANNKIYENSNVKKLFSYNLIKQKLEEYESNNYDFILFGTGKSIEKISDNIIKLLINRNTPYEIMNSVSAFKTYNILLSQRRNILGFLNLAT